LPTSSKPHWSKAALSFAGILCNQSLLDKSGTTASLRQQMSLLRPFNAMDMFRFNSVNLDAW
jgi:hypothetical protein